MIVSFSIDDLKHTVPGAADLASMSGDELAEALRRVLGKAAEGAVIRVDGKMVSLDFGEIPVAQLQEADRLCEKASKQANKGELPKAVCQRCPNIGHNNRLGIAMQGMESRADRLGFARFKSPS